MVMCSGLTALSSIASNSEKWVENVGFLSYTQFRWVNEIARDGMKTFLGGGFFWYEYNKHHGLCGLSMAARWDVYIININKYVYI